MYKSRQEIWLLGIISLKDIRNVLLVLNLDHGYIDHAIGPLGSHAEYFEHSSQGRLRREWPVCYFEYYGHILLHFQGLGKYDSRGNSTHVPDMSQVMSRLPTVGGYAPRFNMNTDSTHQYILIVDCVTHYDLFSLHYHIGYMRYPCNRFLIE